MMGQKFAYMVAAGVAAFMIVMLGALGAYVVLHGQDVQAASSGTAVGSVVAPQSAPNSEQQEEDDRAESDDNESNAGATYAVSAEQAGSIALGTVGGATLLQEPRLVSFQGTVAYEVELDQGTVLVDASSGQVLYDGTSTGRQRRGYHR